MKRFIGVTETKLELKFDSVQRLETFVNKIQTVAFEDNTFIKRYAINLHLLKASIVLKENTPLISNAMDKIKFDLLSDNDNTEVEVK